MNLSVIRYDGESERHILRLRRGFLAGREFWVEMSVCENPLCHCCDINFDCFPLVRKEMPRGDLLMYRFSLNVSGRKVASRQKIDRDSRYLARTMAAELDEEDWHALYSHLVHKKREQLRAADIDELNVEFLPDVLADPSLMVAYSDIFPFEDHFPFRVRDRQWVIVCQFCVSPECDCRHTYITFIPLPGSPGPVRKIEEHAPSVLYEYETDRYRVEDPPHENQPSADELVTGLKEAYPGINADLRERHSILRRLYKKATGKAYRPPSPPPVKVGRNDPCPCGSGKKFKKCCGR